MLYNSPYSNIVTRRISQSFAHLTNNHFPKSHTLNKIFNRNKTGLQLRAKHQDDNRQSKHKHFLHQINKIKNLQRLNTLSFMWEMFIAK